MDQRPGMQRRSVGGFGARKHLPDAGAQQIIGDLAAVARLLPLALGHLAREAQAEQRRLVVREADIGDPCRLEAVAPAARLQPRLRLRSEEHTSELQSLMRISY